MTTNFKPGDRVRRETTDAEGTVISDWAGSFWVQWDDKSGEPWLAERHNGAMLRHVPLTVREAAKALVAEYAHMAAPDDHPRGYTPCISERGRSAWYALAAAIAAEDGAT